MVQCPDAEPPPKGASSVYDQRAAATSVRRGAPVSLPAEEVALRWAIGAAERELGPSHPTTRQLVARRVSVLIRLGRDAEAALLAAPPSSRMSGEEAPQDD
jgi:hypothetical protein